MKSLPITLCQIYSPKHEDIGRILKVECIPILGDTEYPTIFAISSPVSPGIVSLIIDELLNFCCFENVIDFLRHFCSSRLVSLIFNLGASTIICAKN